MSLHFEHTVSPNRLTRLSPKCPRRCNTPVRGSNPDRRRASLYVTTNSHLLTHTPQKHHNPTQQGRKSIHNICLLKSEPAHRSRGVPPPCAFHSTLSCHILHEVWTSHENYGDSQQTDSERNTEAHSWHPLPWNQQKTTGEIIWTLPKQEGNCYTWHIPLMHISRDLALQRVPSSTLGASSTTKGFPSAWHFRAHGELESS